VVIDGAETKVPLGTISCRRQKASDPHPTLCSHPTWKCSICRICVVEVEGQRTLQASCAYPITAPIKISTYSRRCGSRGATSRLAAFGALRDCYACIRNGHCELQALAEEYGVDSFRFGHPEIPRLSTTRATRRARHEQVHPLPRCVRTCIDVQEVGVLEATNRSNRVDISTFLHKPLAMWSASTAGSASTGAEAALYAHPALAPVLEGPRRSPSTWSCRRPVAPRRHGEMFGLEPGTTVTYQMNTALKRMGFNQVFDTNFTADLTSSRRHRADHPALQALVQGDTSAALPQFTSCSPDG